MPENQHDKLVLLCVRADPTFRDVPPAGTKIKHCDTCRQPIYVSPASFERIEQLSKGDVYEFMCYFCAVNKIKADEFDVTRVELPSEAQLREMHQVLNRAPKEN